jgi:Mn2+/Fe2+ NRAMP family transporter
MKNKNGSILAFSVFASGVTTAAILNDAGALNVFSVFGSSYGYSILWELVAMAVVLIVVQEMMSRMAVATGKGLSDLIRENFGVKMSFIAMSILFVSSICSAVANFSGIAESMELIGAGKYIGVFAAATAVILIALAKKQIQGI